MTSVHLDFHLVTADFENSARVGCNIFSVNENLFMRQEIFKDRATTNLVFLLGYYKASLTF